MEDLSKGPPTDINPYEVLELETAATSAEVKTAYRKLALRHHPGTYSLPESSQICHQHLLTAHQIKPTPQPATPRTRDSKK
jgi:curved DNA-binding protein CbpA